MLDIALLVLIGCVNNLSITQKSKTGNHTKNRKTNRLIVIPNRIHYKPGSYLRATSAAYFLALIWHFQRHGTRISQLFLAMSGDGLQSEPFSC